MTAIAIVLALVLGLEIVLLYQTRRILMSTATATQALADLTAAVQSVQAGVTGLQTADTNIDAALATLLAAQSAGQGVAAAAVEALVAQLTTASNGIKPVVADLTTQTANIGTALNPPAISVSVTPATVTVAQGATQQFSATVSNDAKNAGVTWSLAPVVAPALTGTISATGLYTPPTTPGGTDTVIATSVTDPTKSGTAVVTF
jgi:hypothetical protein